MDESIIALQTRLLHQEEDILNLSKELYIQQKELVKLKQQFTALAKRFQSLVHEESGVRDMKDETPPPHY